MWQNKVSQQPGKTRKGKEGGEERDTSRQRALPAGELEGSRCQIKNLDEEEGEFLEQWDKNPWASLLGFSSCFLSFCLSLSKEQTCCILLGINWPGRDRGDMDQRKTYVYIFSFTLCKHVFNYTVTCRGTDIKTQI